MIHADLPKLLRLKVVALVTVEVHARDVIDKLAKTGCSDVDAFEWFCQLRLCYMTLTTALHLHRGGSPKGPAGTGKTETVKDLGKSLGMFVIVVNCSEGLDYKSMGRVFSGLAQQTGAWGCFNEFHRINTEVLSVVAQQILSILSALSAGKSLFQFEGQKIRLLPSCGIFITMNPGRSTGLCRGILMAKKVFTLYSLAVQQLSQQDHYDFGLRALTSLLRYAGRKRRLSPSIVDEEVSLSTSLCQTGTYCC
ncbi:hypothetical protein GOODEAATRI_019308 [Goodea atripinnis]|uniref:Dynein heavy chain hydrolytic ATP-binding dynein motor region domain-containing protein n=1 Tax=Goodea atripinnis TaxID=208336 RepID=A0ABV0N2N8_9TELE